MLNAPVSCVMIRNGDLYIISEGEKIMLNKKAIHGACVRLLSSDNYDIYRKATL